MMSLYTYQFRSTEFVEEVAKDIILGYFKS
jgi:hypothetical protein